MGFLKKYSIEFGILYGVTHLRNKPFNINRIYYLANRVRNRISTLFDLVAISILLLFSLITYNKDYLISIYPLVYI